jgi:hypothetical protein
MDVMLLTGNALKIKGKNASIVVNPTSSTNKTEASSILILNSLPDFSDAKVEGSRITLKGPGEFEVGGVKIAATAVGEKLVAIIDVDSVKVLIGSGEAIEKIQDKVEGSDLLIVNSDTKFNYSSLASLEPKVIIVYGELKDEVSKSLGKVDTQMTNKYSTTVDKLPDELAYVLLG